MKIILGLVLLFLTGVYGVIAQPSENVISSLSISPNKDMIAIGTLKGTLTILDLETLMPLYVLQATGEIITDLSWSTDNTKIATANFSGLIQVWNIISNQKIFEVNLMKNNLVGITEIVWDVEGNYIAIATQNDSAYVLDANDGEIVSRLLTKETYDIDWDITGNLITSGLTGLNIWELNGSLITTLSSPMDFPSNLGFSPDMSKLAIISTSLDSTIYPALITHGLLVFETNTYQLISKFPIVTDYGIYDILWSSNNRYVAIGSQDGVLQIRDTLDGSLVNLLTSPVNMRAFDWIDDITLIYGNYSASI